MSKSVRVLIVDDDESTVDFVSETLSDHGYQVLTALHGGEALAVIGKQPPDLILLDMRTPVVDGWEFVRAYRQMPGPHAPIVVMTAGRNAPGTAAEINAVAYLDKPFALESLLTLVERHAGRPTPSGDQNSLQE